MTDTSTSAVEALADMLARRGYISPPREPEDYAATLTCREALDVAATLRALLAERETLAVERGSLFSIIQRDNATLAELRRENERLATEGRA